MARSHGRTGARWRKARAEVLATSRTCWLCGHDGANQVDHEPSLQTLEAAGLDPCDPQYLRPAHGSLNNCPTCGRCCNQEKGSRAGHTPPLASEDW